MTVLPQNPGTLQQVMKGHGSQCLDGTSMFSNSLKRQRCKEARCTCRVGEGDRALWPLGDSHLSSTQSMLIIKLPIPPRHLSFEPGEKEEVFDPKQK